MRRKITLFLAVCLSFCFVHIISSSEVGRVIGRITPSKDISSQSVKTATLFNDDVCLDTELDKDGSFIFTYVPPGRYLLILEYGAFVLDELEVLPDLTTVINFCPDSMGNISKGQMVTFEEPDPRWSIGGNRQRGYYRLALRHPPMVYPDKTFSGSVFLGEEELRSRRKPLNLEVKRFKRFKGYVITP